MTQRRWFGLTLVLSALGAFLFAAANSSPPIARAEPAPACQPAVESATQAAQADRSPVDLALTPDGALLLVANQSSGTVSLVRVSDGVILDELPCGARPAAVALTPDGHTALVTASHGGQLSLFSLKEGRLHPAGEVALENEPHGIAVSPDGKLAYVALSAGSAVAVVNLETRQVETQTAVGQWPRYLCLTPDGTRLAVGCSGEGGISVVDTAKREKIFSSKFVGLNIGHLAASADGRYAYFPWMVYTDRPITQGNIREGWVLGNRLARVRLDEPARREAIALDPRGKAVADPHGMALSPDEKWLVFSASGTHELVALKTEGLPLRPDGPGDHMKADLAADQDRFVRIPLGGRPMAVKFASGDRVFVANYLNNSVQVVNLAEKRVEREIPLGSAAEPSLARRGEAIFYDALRSTDGWYSCHSCHYDGHTNAVTMDTRNDGSNGTYKMVLSLRHIHETGPWFWHGWQQDLHAAIGRSLVETMQGPQPTDDDVRQVAAYLESLPIPPSKASESGSSLSEQEERGRAVFLSEAANCAACHSGKLFTDGQIHDVGLGSEYDKYQGYNTPSLLGIANRVRYLHHGRALSLDDLLSDLHSPAKVSATRELTDDERADLVAYLQTL
jgi:DNA-binding beta-propeller fold protein YncE